MAKFLNYIFRESQIHVVSFCNVIGGAQSELPKVPFLLHKIGPGTKLGEQMHVSCVFFVLNNEHQVFLHFADIRTDIAIKGHIIAHKNPPHYVYLCMEGRPGNEPERLCIMFRPLGDYV